MLDLKVKREKMRMKAITRGVNEGAGGSDSGCRSSSGREACVGVRAWQVLLWPRPIWLMFKWESQNKTRTKKKKKKKSWGVDAPGRWRGIRSVSGKPAAVSLCPPPPSTETWSKGKPDTADASTSHTRTHRALSSRVLELPLWR